MTKKYLDLEIIDKSLENEILLKIINVQIPSIVNCSYHIKKQYFLVIFPLDHKLEKISIYIFKKQYNEDNKNFIYNTGTCKKNFILNFTKITETNKNWKNLIDNKIKMEDIIINFLEEHNIKSEDYTSYRSLYYGIKNTDFFVEDIWGEETTEFNIDWIITLESIIKKYFGEDYKDYTPKYDSFIKTSIKRIYYPYCLNYCPIYKFISQSCIFKCDNCLKFFDKNQNEKDIWHNHLFGDLCNFCYQKIKSEYFLKIKKNWNISLQVAKKKLFQNELKNTIRFLNQKKIMNLNIEKKNFILKNVIQAINNNSRKNHCSICLDVLDTDLSTGSCGHCFHTKCIKMLVSDKCPVCRTKTEYIKLHL